MSEGGTGQVRWCLNYNGHIVHWTCLVTDQTYLKTSLESSEGTRQVWMTGLAME
jgi:hypothetical protein